MLWCIATRCITCVLSMVGDGGACSCVCLCDFVCVACACVVVCSCMCAYSTLVYSLCSWPCVSMYMRVQKRKYVCECMCVWLLVRVLLERSPCVSAWLIYISYKDSWMMWLPYSCYILRVDLYRYVDLCALTVVSVYPQVSLQSICDSSQIRSPELLLVSFSLSACFGKQFKWQTSETASHLHLANTCTSGKCL